MAGFDTAIASVPGKERLGKHSHGGRIIVHVTAMETAGVIGSWDTFSAPGTGPHWHIHSRETEVFRVIEGTYRFWCGSESFEGGPGLTITLPPYVPHCWRNVGSTPGRMMGVVTPGGFEQLFLEIARSSGGHDAMLAIEAGLGVTNGGPALAKAIAGLKGPD